MIAVLGLNESVTVVLAGAAATTNPSYHAIWHEHGSQSVNQPTGALNGATAVTLVAAPTSGQARRYVDSIVVFNRDTAAVTLTLAKVIDGTSYTIVKAALPVGAHLIWDEDGFRVLDSAGQHLQSINSERVVEAGTAANGAVAVETGNVARKTVLTLVDVPVTVGNTTGVSFGGTKVYDFPAGRILILGATLAALSFDLTDAGNATPIDAADGGDVAFGTTPPTDGTLTGTDVDIIPSTSIDPISGGITGVALAASAQFDGTTTAKDINVNIIIDDADVGDGASDVLLVNGVLTVHWVNLGDY